MKVYFYHTQDIQYILKRMGEGEFPPHYLYGAAKLERHGIGVVWHKAKLGLPRWRMMLRNAWQVLTCKEHFDAVYATHYRGLELIVLLRALRLFRKPVVIWHHQPIVNSPKRWREWLGRLFYKGFDRMFFFSQKLIDDSLLTAKADPTRMVLGHWGADLDFYDRVIAATDGTHDGFVSTGKEMRDMPTLVNAFNATGADLDIYVARVTGDVSYEHIFGKLPMRRNIRLKFVERLIPYELSLIVARAECVAICCQETKYTTMGDFCVALYNPSSKGRPDYLAKAVRILLENGKSADTVCGLVRNIGRDGQTARVLSLAQLESTAVDMFTTVYIGNTATKQLGGKMVTPRGYRR